MRRPCVFEGFNSHRINVTQAASLASHSKERLTHQPTAGDKRPLLASGMSPQPMSVM